MLSAYVHATCIRSSRHAKQTLLTTDTWNETGIAISTRMQRFRVKITSTQELRERRGGGSRQYLTFQRTLHTPQESHANERDVWSALTSLEEKVSVWERPDRLGSTTSPEKSEAGLLWFESSSTDKLWNGHRKQDLLSKHKDWGIFSSLRLENELMHSPRASRNQLRLLNTNTF